MFRQVQQEVIDAAVERVSSIDLDKLRISLTDANEGPGWSEEKCASVETRYRAMLVGKPICPSVVIAPDKEVDEFWHTHILDTRAYIEDCDTLFGGYIHHDPYLGMEGEESKKALNSASEATKELYEVLGASDSSKKLAEVAFCGMSVESPTAFCGMEADDQAAFCGMDSSETAAFCGMDVGTLKPTTA